MTGASNTSDGTISIHAPSRERLHFWFNIKQFHLFQFTLPRGSDSLMYTAYCPLLDFNPRSLAGATKCSYKVRLPASISIHAPSRERRSDSTSFSLRCCDFNPRSLAGATGSSINGASALSAFQSTLPRGSDGRKC